MKLWWEMLASSLMIPVIMIICGSIMYKYCPKKVNRIVGYRTRRSMINIDTWKFANEYCGRFWIKFGIITMALSVLSFFFLYNCDENIIVIIETILMIIQLVIIVVSIIMTEIALKRNFDEYGDPRYKQ